MTTADDISHVASRWLDPPRDARDLAVSVDAKTWVPYLNLVDPLKPWDYPYFRWRNLSGGWNTGGAILRRAMSRPPAGTTGTRGR